MLESLPTHLSNEGSNLPTASQSALVLSVRPKYCEKILAGLKTAELRRRFPTTLQRNTIAFIYCTSPIRSLVGSAEISTTIKLSTSSIWRRYRDHAFIEKSDFDAYFSGLNEGYVLTFVNARALPRALKLPELRERFGFAPPRSFHYVKQELHEALRNEYSKNPD